MYHLGDSVLPVPSRTYLLGDNLRSVLYAYPLDTFDAGYCTHIPLVAFYVQCCTNTW